MTSGVLSNVAWVPKTSALLAAAKQDFEKYMYNDKQCSSCEYLPERHCEVCTTCPAFLGHYRLWRKRRNKETGKRYIGFPTGNRKLLKSTLDGIRLKDRRVRVPMKHDLRFTGKYRGSQEDAVNRMAKKGYGLIEAPPRTGKTVMSTAVVCKVGYKAIILASQTEWLKGFLDTFIGNKQTGAKAMTNARDYGGNKHVIGFANTLEEFKKYDVCLVTYQTFLSAKGQKLLKQAASMFGTVVVDEADKVAARCFLSVINQFKAAVRFGVTGTPERKDKRHILTEYVLGPVIHEVEIETLVPRVQIIETKIKLPRKYGQWSAFENALVEHTERNKLILKHALHDIREGRFVVIPVTRVHHAVALAKALNRMAGESVATHFIGPQTKAEREAIVNKAQNGLIQCVVGMRQLLQRGVNVPVWDMLYEVMPISNPPNFHQETSRIRTTNPGKPQPVIKHFIEDAGQSRGCLRTCYWGTYKPEGFIINPKDLKIMMKYMGRGDVQDSEPTKRIRF